jgi:hypothetical protein
MSGWIGVDLDGTLALYDGWKGVEHIGAPIPRMVERVKEWLAKGREVRIFTARAWQAEELTLKTINEWAETHIGQRLPITCEKDYHMIELWDDRAIRVVENTGQRCCEISGHLYKT